MVNDVRYPGSQLPDWESIPIPSLQEESAAHQRVQRHIGMAATQETMSFGQLLMRLPGRQQFVVRGIHGLYPFTHPQTRRDLSDVCGANVGSSLHAAYRALSRPEDLAKRPSLVRGLTLEAVARRLADLTFPLNVRQRVIIRAFYGLPPYTRPAGKREAGVIAGMSQPSYIGRYLAMALAAIAHPPQPERPPPREVQADWVANSYNAKHPDQAVFFKRRDAGRYAELLMRLRDPDTGDAWCSIVRDDLHRASVRRTESFQQAHETTGKLAEILPLPRDVDNGFLLHSLQHRSGLDTPEGIEELLERLLNRAITMDAETAKLLPQIIEEGQQARKDLTAMHTGLVQSALRRISHKYTVPFDRLPSDVGVRALQEAVNNFNPYGPTNLSSYALRCILGAVLRDQNIQLSKRYAITKDQLGVMRRVFKAEQDFNTQHGRLPDDSKLIELTGLDARVIELYRSLELYGEEVAVAADDRRLSKEQFKRAVISETDNEVRSELGDALQELFLAAGLSALEQAVVRSRVDCSDEEISQFLSLSREKVTELYSQAVKKITAVENAKKILRNNIS